MWEQFLKIPYFLGLPLDGWNCIFYLSAQFFEEEKSRGGMMQLSGAESNLGELWLAAEQVSVNSVRKSQEDIWCMTWIQMNCHLASTS